MVAAKKPVKKSTAKKAPVRKKTPAKRKPASHTRATARSRAGYASFKLARDRSFFKWQVTVQTVYWLVLLVVIIVFQAVILTQEINIMNILSKTTTL